MSSSSDRRPRTRVIRGTRADGSRTATLDVDLNTVVVAGAPAGHDRIEAATAEGYREGYQQGLAQGRAEALATTRSSVSEQRQRLGTLGDALAGAVDDLHRRDGDMTEAIVADAVELAFRLAETILGRELELSASPGRDAVARALAIAPDSGDALVRLHPDDVAVLGDAASLDPSRRLTVAPDPAVERGGCVVEVGEARIDAQLSAALERARTVIEEAGRR